MRLNILCLFLGHCVLVSLCFAEVSNEIAMRRLQDFITQIRRHSHGRYIIDNGTVLNVEKIGEHGYKIDAELHGTENNKYVGIHKDVCTVTFESYDGGALGLPSPYMLCKIPVKGSDGNVTMKTTYGRRIYERDPVPTMNNDEATSETPTVSVESKERDGLIMGGVIERDPNDPKYSELAQESMEKYLQTTGNWKTYRVNKVEKVTEQAVSGLLTHILFTIVPTYSTGLLSCESVIWEQSWLKKKEINVSCEIENNQAREKRELPGQETDRDPNNSKYMDLAQESLAKYMWMRRNWESYKVIQINRVTTQLVSGLLTRVWFKMMRQDGTGDVKSCFSKVWDQGLNERAIDVSCKVDSKQPRGNSEWTGAATVQDPNDPKYIELARESMEKYLQTSGNRKTYKVKTIKKVTEQLVSGSLIRISFTIVPRYSTGDILSCESEIWEQPWLMKKDINVSCGK